MSDNDVNEIAALARESMTDRTSIAVGAGRYGKKYFVLTQGESIATLQPEPSDLIKETTQAHDVYTFVALAKRAQMPQSVLFHDRTNGRIEFVVDYHSAAAESDEDNPIEPGLKQHRIVLVRTPTLAWEAWRTHNGVKMTQDAFAEFLDERAIDVVKPSGADMLELARSFHATRTATFSRAMQAGSGDVQLQWRQQTTAGAGEGAGIVTVPSEFLIEVEPWYGAPRLALRALFRYRLGDEGALRLFYVFAPDPTEALQLMVGDTARDIAAALGVALHLAVIP